MDRYTQSQYFNSHGDILLRNTRVPSAVLEASILPLTEDADGLTDLDVRVVRGEIHAIRPAGLLSPNDNEIVIDLQGRMVWPCYVDLHTHLDKSHTCSRTPHSERTLAGAISADQYDQATYWNVEDLVKRMDFALRCAYAHGTRALRTHLMSGHAVRSDTWRAFEEVREIWKERITLQAVSLIEIDEMAGDSGVQLADFTAEHGGLLGCAIIGAPAPDIAVKLDHFFSLAHDRRLNVDIHADENLEPSSHALRYISEAVVRNDFCGRVTVGHCCSMSVQSEEDVEKTLSAAATADVSIVCLPETNLYLQDRCNGVTPMRRGITRLLEIQDKQISVALASDNCRDFFNLFGDYDLHSVFRQAVLLGHLDMNLKDWPSSVSRTPAQVMGLDENGSLSEGQSADLIVFEARSYGELLSRPQSDRLILRKGKPISAKVPKYHELDAI